MPNTVLSSTIPVQSATALPYIPDSAPFSSAQRQYLNGLFAGLFTGTGAPAAMSPAKPVLPVTILVGTESGNCATLARKLGKEATKRGFDPSIIDLADFNPPAIRDLRHIAIMTSTHGDGDPPENARALHEYLFSEDCPLLEDLHFSVLALGDRNYPQFCQCGRDFDRRLEERGARRFYERMDCDSDYGPGFEQWSEGVLAALKAFDPAASTNRSSPAPSNSGQPADQPARQPGFSRRNPYTARLLKSESLNTAASEKETRHVEIDLADSGLQYEAGDALGVVPSNCPVRVQSILDALNFDGEEAVLIHTEQSFPLRLALTHHYEIRNISPGFLRRLAKSPRAESIRTILSEPNSSAVDRIREREIIDLVLELPAAIRSPQFLLECLDPLQPRLYSIASSQKAVGNAVHLTVGVVRYQSGERACTGVCSGFLAERARDEGLKIFVQPNRSFRLPADTTTPIIMVGPGTGIAPFRAFLQERQVISAEGDAWLFFGDRSSKDDFLYQDELAQFLRSGTLTRLDTAWSRDQDHKVYVQDRMRENGAELFAWFQRGAHFYVCGDASHMAPDVESALLDILREHGGMTKEEAAARLTKLREEKRYLRDVY